MSKFTDHLWADLAQEHGAALARTGQGGPRARLLRRPGLLAGSTLGLAGVGTAVALAVGAAGSSPAYAVTTNANGSVTVQIDLTSSLPQANAKLAAMGIDERVAIFMAAGPAAVSGPVICTAAPGATVSGPPVAVLVGQDGTEVINPGQTGGNTGVGTWHLDHCVVSGDAGSSNSGNTGVG